MAAKMRSPNYPAISLPDALAIAQKLWDKERRTPVTIELLAKIMGYASVSGPVRTKIAAMKKYGLIEDRSGLRLSDLAMRILHGPQGSEQKQDAIREAALKPELFRELYEKYPDASDQTLNYHLMMRKFSEAGAKQLIQSYRDTIEVAKLTEEGYSPQETTSGSEDIMESQVTTDSPPVRRNPILTSPSSQPGEKIVRFNWPVSKDVIAEVTFRGGDVNVTHLKTLTKYLELMQNAIEEMDK